MGKFFSIGIFFSFVVVSSLALGTEPPKEQPGIEQLVPGETVVSKKKYAEKNIHAKCVFPAPSDDIGKAIIVYVESELVKNNIPGDVGVDVQFNGDKVSIKMQPKPDLNLAAHTLSWKLSPDCKGKVVWLSQKPDESVLWASFYSQEFALGLPITPIAIGAKPVVEKKENIKSKERSTEFWILGLILGVLIVALVNYRRR